ncbi:MAG: hypothetical protein ACI4QN_02045 [Candidatus Coproplasma sp.]
MSFMESYNWVEINNINKIIENVLKTPKVTEIYQSIANNRHLDLGTAIKLGAVYEVRCKCDTYGGWISNGYRILTGKQSVIEMPYQGKFDDEYYEEYENEYADDDEANYRVFFKITQTTAVDEITSNRTLENLISTINHLANRGKRVEKVDFSAIVKAIKNYYLKDDYEFNEYGEKVYYDKDIGFFYVDDDDEIVTFEDDGELYSILVDDEPDIFYDVYEDYEFYKSYESVIISGVASILAYTCSNWLKIRVTPEPFPENYYEQNLKALVVINEIAKKFLDMLDCYSDFKF